MENPFRDAFGAMAADYARFRPRYPAALYELLARAAPGRDRAWDCATGNGQAAVGLAEHFHEVIATDGSAGQLAAAQPHPRVSYRAAPAHESGLESGSCALVTVAQALHWFPREKFYAEARRVLRPRGVLAVWCYAKTELGEPALDDAFGRYYTQTIGPYWEFDRGLVDSGYATLEFPFEEIAWEPMVIEGQFTFEAFLGYLGTWSPLARYRRERGSDPLPALGEALAPRWGDRARTVRWPLGLRVGRR